MNRNTELLFHHLPPEISINLESEVHNAVQTFDEAVEVLHLLCHVLVVLQRHLVLPKCGKETNGEKLKLHDTTGQLFHYDLSQQSNIPHNLLAVPLLFLLGCDLNLQTVYLTVQTLGCPTYFQALWTDLSSLGHRCLNHRVKQQCR